ncbi:carbohydrate ABC transporter permease [Marinibacterium profundimaris]|uniref:carbohydrate ABC transporter permease n=1 Tax=Marinibacterium profundimaris TaxID=1679460 RepID=UPI000B520BD3|nr:sugar ABC transporter permease [Marinibacterium profundimaris]
MATTDHTAPVATGKRPRRWHIPLLLAPAAIVYTLVMIWPLVDSLRLSFFDEGAPGERIFVGLQNYRALFGSDLWWGQFWNALVNNFEFFAIHMLVQNPIGIALAAILSLPALRGKTVYRTIFFIPAVLSYVIVGFVWRLILSPTWGIAPDLLDRIGLGFLYQPWLGQTDTALITLSLISVWQFIGIPMMLIYAALLSIPDELIEAAECDGITGVAQFFKIKLPLLWPSIGIISILTFVGNFNAFDLVYVTQGPFAAPDGSTDLLGTFLFRTFFGSTSQLGDPYMGATIATAMFGIIVIGVLLYLFGIQRRLTYYQM